MFKSAVAQLLGVAASLSSLLGHLLRVLSDNKETHRNEVHSVVDQLGPLIGLGDSSAQDVIPQLADGLKIVRFLG